MKWNMAKIVPRVAMIGVYPADLALSIRSNSNSSVSTTMRILSIPVLGALMPASVGGITLG